MNKSLAAADVYDDDDGDTFVVRRSVVLLISSKRLVHSLPQPSDGSGG